MKSITDFFSSSINQANNQNQSLDDDDSENENNNQNVPIQELDQTKSIDGGRNSDVPIRNRNYNIIKNNTINDKFNEGKYERNHISFQI